MRTVEVFEEDGAGTSPHGHAGGMGGGMAGYHGHGSGGISVIATAADDYSVDAATTDSVLTSGPGAGKAAAMGLSATGALSSLVDQAHEDIPNKTGAGAGAGSSSAAAAPPGDSFLSGSSTAAGGAGAAGAASAPSPSSAAAAAAAARSVCAPHGPTRGFCFADFHSHAAAFAALRIIQAPDFKGIPCDNPLGESRVMSHHES